MDHIDILFADQAAQQSRVLPHGQRVLRIGVHVNHFAARTCHPELQASTGRGYQRTSSGLGNRIDHFQCAALDPALFQSRHDLQDRQPGIRL